MKRSIQLRRLAVLPLSLMIAHCQESKIQTAAEDPEAQPVSSELAGPQRAKAAADRVRPLLKERLAQSGLAWGNPVYLRIFKEESVLELWMQPKPDSKFQLFKSYPILAFSGQLGPKFAEGDRQAPEGFYAVGKRAMNPASRYHLSFNLGYPNAYDRHHGRTGSFLMVHGNQVSIGCYAMGDLQIEEIYSLCDAALQAGQPFFRVHCFPFKMTPTKMAQTAENESHEFWLNLKQGYDWFNQKGTPPDVTEVDGKYAFR